MSQIVLLEPYHAALFDAVQKVCEWEQEYRETNHLGNTPPHVFTRLSLLAAALAARPQEQATCALPGCGKPATHQYAGAWYCDGAGQLEGARKIQQDFLSQIRKRFNDADLHGHYNLVQQISDEIEEGRYVDWQAPHASGEPEPPKLWYTLDQLNLMLDTRGRDEFQRGEKAMAEKAAQYLDSEANRRRHFKLEDAERGLKNAEVMWQMGADWAERDAKTIRSLAVEPPQEKEQP